MKAHLAMGALLLALVVGSAVGVVVVQQANRDRFGELERLRWAADELEADWSRLRLEEASLSEYAQVERIARERLGMRPVRPEEMEVVLP